MAFVWSGSTGCGRGRRRTEICMSSGDFVDENQYTLRNKRRRVRLSDFDLAKLPREVHTHVFVRDEIDESFEMSFRREIDALRRFRDQSADDFVMTMRHVADPSWGINRGRPPRHPRYVIVEAERQSASVKVDEHGDKVENGQEEGTKSLGSMGRWLNALTRVGDGVLRDLSHEVSYRRIASCGDVKLGLNSERNVDDMIVVTEMINADWTSLSKVQGLSEALKERANEVVVTLGAARKMVVLQSDVEPSFFKTVEYYNNDEGLIAHMKATDSAFSENIKAYKAAVNRVRQAFKILKT